MLKIKSNFLNSTALPCVTTLYVSSSLFAASLFGNRKLRKNKYMNSFWIFNITCKIKLHDNSFKITLMTQENVLPLMQLWQIIYMNHRQWSYQTFQSCLSCSVFLLFSSSSCIFYAYICICACMYVYLSLRSLVIKKKNFYT